MQKHYCVNWKQSSFVGPGLLISNNDCQVHTDDNSIHCQLQYQSISIFQLIRLLTSTKSSRKFNYDD